MPVVDFAHTNPRTKTHRARKAGFWRRLIAQKNKGPDESVTHQAFDLRLKSFMGAVSLPQFSSVLSH
jgi:hypothetical protein